MKSNITSQQKLDEFRSFLNLLEMHTTIAFASYQDLQSQKESGQIKLIIPSNQFFVDPAVNINIRKIN